MKPKKDDHDYSVRYTKEYLEILRPKALKATDYRCCWCLKHSKKLECHHAAYGNDKIGYTLFPVCLTCHDILHIYYDERTKKGYWLHDFDDPVWQNRNTDLTSVKLRFNYSILTSKVKTEVNKNEQLKQQSRSTTIRKKPKKKYKR